MHKIVIMLLTVAMVAGSQLRSRPSLAQGLGGGEAPPATALKGKILERLDAPPYTYLKLATGSGEVWAAVPQTPAAVGSEVTVPDAFPMKEFESKTLKRKFDVVYFGTLGSAEAAKLPAASGGALPPGHPPTSGDGAGMAAQHQAAAAGPSDVKQVKVAKASGPDARTVAEVYAQRADVKDKPVAVQGQVVKFNAGIMGRNWIHLRDGSGSADKGDNDITVTTQDKVAVADVITVKGTVRLDKDFGAGYVYPVIVEDATVTK